jgi:hypothetical protein
VVELAKENAAVREARKEVTRSKGVYDRTVGRV